SEVEPCRFSLWQRIRVPFAAKANQTSFAWCHGHGAKRMVHPSQKVVTSGIACNTISRKW
ncbi:hypothetical protein, partial [Bacteroides finegoldii]|uniref:hypothetical protein n=1 Tax=Bacteroides finegoldii TaxID=338188 RepID=UPI00234D3D79